MGKINNIITIRHRWSLWRNMIYRLYSFHSNDITHLICIHQRTQITNKNATVYTTLSSYGTTGRLLLLIQWFVAYIQYYKMDITQKLIIVSSLFVVFFRLHFASTSTTKSKRCIEYRVQDGRWNKKVLGIVTNITERDCLMQCVRNERCMAYNMWHRNGTCEWLPQMGKCDEVEKQKDCTFVSLGDCTKEVPWITGRLEWVAESPCLKWQYFDSTLECPATYLRAPVGVYCVALIPQKGLYLPGWHRSDRFRFITLDERPTRCTSGYLLQVAPTCSMVWADYEAGDLVPERAVVGGTWKDGTPLYIVASDINNVWVVGYYRPYVKRFFFPRQEYV